MQSVSKRQLFLMMVSIAVVTAVTTALSLTYFQKQVFAQESTQSANEAAAVIGTAITYQGYLQDDSGVVDGTVNMRFRLYDAVTNGTQLGEVVVDDVVVENGRFTTALDFGDGAYAGQATWLEIAAGAPLETLTPRQPLTAAPIAQSLPNVYTDPATGFVGIGTKNRASAYTQFQVEAEQTSGWGGMYVATSGLSGRPFYGYSLDGNRGDVWHEYNGSNNRWELYMGNNDPALSITTSDEMMQPRSSSGLTKAAVVVHCADAGAATVTRSVNNVNDSPITVLSGVLTGECTVDFGFDISDRYWTVTAIETIDTVGVTCNTAANDRLECLRWRADGSAIDGPIMITIH